MSVQTLRIRLPGLAVVVSLERLRRETRVLGPVSDRGQEPERRAAHRYPAATWEATNSITSWR